MSFFVESIITFHKFLESVNIMAALANKFDALSMEDATNNIADKIEDAVASAMAFIPDRSNRKGDAGPNRELVGDIVKAVVAALLPMVSSLSAQIKDAPQHVSQKAQAVIQAHDNRLDEIEQYSRRDNIVFRGVPETPGESTTEVVKAISEKAGVVLSDADISTTHRVGRPSPSKPRPIVARFVRRDTRTNLLRKKKQLKDDDNYKDVILTEHLAPARAKLLHAVKNDEGTERVWTLDCKIHCTLKSDPQKKYVLTSPEDLFKQLGWEEEKLKRSGLFVDISG